MEQYRMYRLVKLTGWTRDQILDAPAVELDWLLKIEEAEADARNSAQERANRKAA